MPSLRTLTPDTTEFPWQNRQPVEALISTLAIGGSLLLGHITHQPTAGAIMAGGAFFAGFASLTPVLRSPLWSMVLTTLGIATATAIGSLCAQSTPLTLAVAVIAALNYAIFSHLSHSAGNIAQRCGVVAIIAGYFPGGVHYAAGRLSMTLLGGLLQIVLHLLVALVRNRRTLHETVHAPIASRTAELLRTLRAQTLAAPETVSYAARMVVTLIIATALYRKLGIRNGYWVPMTALLVLKPEWSSTLSRGIARLIGTVAGAAIALAIGAAYPIPALALSLFALTAAFLCYMLQSVNYAVYSLAITLYIVFNFAFGGFSEHTAAHLRLFNTLLGGGLALTIDFLWSRFTPRSPLVTRPS